MIIINENNYDLVKMTKFNLWSFMNTKIDMGMEDSLKLFGRHTTYRYCINIDLEKVEGTVPYISLLLLNKHVSNKEVYNRFPDKRRYILSLFENPWDRLTITEDLTYSEIIKTHYDEISTVALSAEKLNGIFKVIRDYEDVPLIPLYTKLYRLQSAVRTPIELISTISYSFPANYLDCLVLGEDDLDSVLGGGLAAKDRIPSLLIANGRVKDVRELVTNTLPGERHIPLKANDVLNISLDLEDLLAEDLSWKYTSQFSKVTRRLEHSEVTKYFLDTGHYYFERLKCFDDDNKVIIVENLLESKLESALGDVTEELLFTVFDLIHSGSVSISNTLTRKLLDYAIESEDPKYLWGLYLTNSFSDCVLKGEIEKNIKR